MKKTLLLTLALAAALAHSETFNAPHTDGDKKVVLGGAGVALTPEVAQLHEQAVAALFSGQARAAIPLLDKAIARYEKQFAADPRQRYAASGNVETLFYLTKAANEGKEAYNKEIPKAKGEADRMIQEARGYAVERINKAEGDVARFNAVYAEYSKAPDITKRRLYLETLDKIFSNTDKVIFIDKNVKNFLPLKNLSGGEQ